MKQYVLCIEKTAMLLHYVKEAHDLGYKCILMTSNRYAYNTLSAEERELVDILVEIDTNDVTLLGERAKELAKEYDIVGVFSFLEYAIPAVAHIAEVLGLPGNSYESTVLARSKALQRQRFAEYHVPSARFHEVNSLEELEALEPNLDYPLILKPVDLSASRNVYKCHTFTELKNHYVEAVKFKGHPYGGAVSGRYLVEEFLKGHEYSVETFMCDGQFHFVAITNKETAGDGTFVEIEHDVSTEILAPLRDKVPSVVKAAVCSLGIRHGFTHTEVKIDGDDVRIVEVNNRLAGDKIPNLMKLAYGLDCWRAVIELAVGCCPDCHFAKEEAATVQHIVAAPGVIKAIEGVDRASRLPGIEDVHIYDSVGKAYRGLIDDSDLIIGYVIGTGPDLASSRQRVSEAIKAITVVTE